MKKIHYLEMKLDALLKVGIQLLYRCNYLLKAKKKGESIFYYQTQHDPFYVSLIECKFLMSL